MDVLMVCVQLDGEAVFAIFFFFTLTGTLLLIQRQKGRSSPENSISLYGGCYS